MLRFRVLAGPGSGSTIVGTVPGSSRAETALRAGGRARSALSRDARPPVGAGAGAGGARCGAGDLATEAAWEARPAPSLLMEWGGRGPPPQLAPQSGRPNTNWHSVLGP